MDPQARIDYFRSEIEGKLKKLEDEMKAMETRQAAKLATLEARIDNALRAVSTHSR